jgi:hypothetical protein
MCPVCTIAIGTGLGLSRFFGVDDLVSGVWIGGLLVSLIGMTILWLNKKNLKNNPLRLAVVFLYYFLTIGPLYWGKVVGAPCNHIWGLDKIVWGIIIGSVFFLISYAFHLWLKKKNQNKVFFPFQKVVIPVIFLVIASFILYFGVCR